MSVFDGVNISCVLCRHRHPAGMPCIEAARIANANRAARRQEEEDQARADSLGISVAEAATLPRREDAKFAPLPESAGKPLSMVVFEGALLVCCEYGVYRRAEVGSWELLPI